MISMRVTPHPAYSPATPLSRTIPTAACASESYTLGEPCAASTVRTTSNGYVHTVADAPAMAPPRKAHGGAVGSRPASRARLRNSPSDANWIAV